MAQVSKTLDITASIGNNKGEFVLNGEIPDAWSDYLGGTATMASPDGWVGQVRRTGEDQLTLRCFRRNSAGEVEFVPQNEQVQCTLVLHGVT